MIPVDLNRLREARRVWGTYEFSNEGMDAYRDTVDTVLDAPTVWWCAEVRQVGPRLCAKDAGCGWVALVPVKEATDV